MLRGIPADRTHKAEIVAKIRDQGLSVSAASTQYQLSSKTIYTGERQGVRKSGSLTGATHKAVYLVHYQVLHTAVLNL